MPISTPSQITVPFATSGLKNAIPSTSNPVTGNAGYDAGFPATNMTPKEAGGIPPFGQDFNGILFDITTAIRYLEAGMQFPYSSSFATAVGGYPLGAIVTRTDGTGFWRNTVANNTTNPETFGAGWQPEGAGISTVSMSNANVTLTALQAAQPIILITGTLTANLNLILPAYTKQWAVVNSATGASFGVTVKTAAGSGYQVMTGESATVFGDGTNIRGIVLVTPQATESVSGIAKIATQALTNAGVDDATIVTPKKLFAAQQTALNLKMNLTGDGAVPRLGAVSVNSAGLNVNQQGGYLLWNVSGEGRTSLLNNQGDGIGGFIFKNINKDNTVETGRVTIDGSGALSSTDNITAAGNIRSGNGAATLIANGDVNGSVWDGWLSTYIANRTNMVGASVGFYLNAAPAGWLKENGAAVSRTTYAKLFAIIGTAFGAGDGSTTFNLPDHRGEFPRGADDSRGVDAGRTVGSTQGQAIQSHSHPILNKATSFSYSAAAGGGAPGNSVTGATELTGGPETRPRNIAKLYCIKY